MQPPRQCPEPRDWLTSYAVRLFSRVSNLQAAVRF